MSDERVPAIRARLARVLVAMASDTITDNEGADFIAVVTVDFPWLLEELATATARITQMHSLVDAAENAATNANDDALAASLRAERAEVERDAARTALAAIAEIREKWFAKAAYIMQSDDPQTRAAGALLESCCEELDTLLSAPDRGIGDYYDRMAREGKDAGN